MLRQVIWLGQDRWKDRVFSLPPLPQAANESNAPRGAPLLLEKQRLA